MLGNRILRRTGIVTVLAVGSMALGLAPAAADPPVKSDLDLVLDDQDCGGGLTYDVEASGIETVHIKPDGTLTIFQNWHGTIEGSNGETLRLHHAFTTSIAPDGTLTVTGLPFGTWDGGSSILDRGLVVIGPGTFKVAGPHPAGPPPGNHLATCALLVG